MLDIVLISKGTIVFNLTQRIFKMYTKKQKQMVTGAVAHYSTHILYGVIYPVKTINVNKKRAGFKVTRKTQ